MSTPTTTDGTPVVALTPQQVVVQVPTYEWIRDEEAQTWRAGGDIHWITVIGERTGNDALAITPSVHHDGTFGRNGHTLVHVPTGLAAAAGTIGQLRKIAERVAHLPWGEVTSRDDFQARPDVIEPTREAKRDLAFDLDPDEEPPPAAPYWDDTHRQPLHEITNATDMIRGWLGDLQLGFTKTFGEDAVPFDVPDPTSERGQRPNPEYMLWIMRNVHTYGLVYLLAALQRVDPRTADCAARMLNSAWESGDAIGEWSYQWGQEARRGDPLTVPGLPDVTPEPAVPGA